MFKIGSKIAWLCLVGGALSGCTPPHYSVAVASTADRVVYAQRHPKTHVDYLVDCQMVKGVPQNCQTIPLHPID